MNAKNEAARIFNDAAGKEILPAEKKEKLNSEWVKLDLGMAGDEVDAEIKFSCWAGERETWTDPGSPEEYDIDCVLVEGKDIYWLLGDGAHDALVDLIKAEKSK